MAKKNDAQAFDTFLADVLAAVPEDKREAVKEALEAEDVSSVVRPRVLAQADYSKHMDLLREEKTRFEQEVQEARERIARWNKWYEDTSKEVVTLKEANDRYREHYGDIDDDDGNADAGNRGGGGMGKAELEKMLTEKLQAVSSASNAAAIAFASQLVDIQADHRHTFGEKLNVGELIEFANQNQLPLEAAYQSFTAEKAEEKRSKDLDERIKRERDEATAEALSKHNLPVIPSSSEHVHVLDTEAKVAKNPNDRIRAATSAFFQKHSG